MCFNPLLDKPNRDRIYVEIRHSVILDLRGESPTEEASMAEEHSRGVIEKPSNHSVDETVERIKGLLQSKGITLFALIDHSGEAEKAGLKMPSTRLLIFGSPKGGTPLMLAAPGIALDLPLKLLVREDSQGKVWISYNTPEYLLERHGASQQFLKNIAVAESLAMQAGN